MESYFKRNSNFKQKYFYNLMIKLRTSNIELSEKQLEHIQQIKELSNA